MNELILLVLLGVLAFSFLQNRRLLKRNKHIKNYIKCSDAIFNDDPDMLEITKNYIESEDENEFANKGRVIYIYALLQKGVDAKEEVAKLDLKDTFISKKEKFDAKKFEYNSDTYFWLIVTLIKAHVLADKDVVDGLVKAVERYYDFISQDVVVKLFFAVHHCLAHDEFADPTFLKDLWAGNYPAGCTYDKRLIGFYKYLAIATLAKLGEPLDEEMNTDLRNFAAMKAGVIVLRDFGILDTYRVEVEEEYDLAIEGEEDVIDVEADVVTSDDEVSSDVAMIETTEEAADPLTEEAEVAETIEGEESQE